MPNKRRRRPEPEGEVSSSVQPSRHAGPSRALEALGIAMMLVSLGLCFSLWSFDPADRTGERNLVGQVGRSLAEAILSWIGVIGYLGALFSVAAAGAALVGRLRRPSLITLASSIAVVLGASVAADGLVGEVLERPAGGAVGSVLGAELRELAGPVGTGLAAAGACLLGLMGIADLSPARVLLGVCRALQRGLDRAADHWAASMAARRRAREIALAARAVEARARAEEVGMAVPEDRAFSRPAVREERRRSMVARAVARAEAKALERAARRRRRKAPERAGPEGWAGALEEAPEALAGVDPELGLEDAASVIERIEAEQVEALVRATPASAERAPASASGSRAPRSRAGGPDASALASEAEGGRPEASPAREVGAIGRGPPVLADGTEGAACGIPGEAEDRDGALGPTESLAAPNEEEAAGVGSNPGAVFEAEGEEDDAGLEAALSDLGADGPLIHERKVTAVRFDDEPVSPPPPKVEERKVYRLPPIHLLDHEGENPDPVDQEALRERATRLEHKLETYGVRGKVTAIRPGPVVTTYEYQPAPGVKVSKIQSLQDDIAMSMEALRVRIVAPIPGRGVVGIELPNERRENVYLKEIVAHDRFRRSKSLLTLALGKDAEGDPQVRDLQKMPHLLVAGTTGSGKSVSINTMILSMLYKATPDQVKFIMVDPKMLELSLYNDIPHLLLPVVTDPRQASLALQWTVDEMERRYKLLSDFKVRDLESFNRKLERLRAQREADAARDAVLAAHEAAVAEAEAAGAPPPAQAELPFEEEDAKGRIRDPWPNREVPDELPYIVVLIDEFADLMTVAPRDVETSVQRLAQKARAAGIHVLLATQRPSTDVITGVIKNNFPCRIAFRVASRHDSATIINMPGAEALLGRGDSLMMDTSSPTPYRIHGSFVSEEEVERVAEFWKEQGRPAYDETILRPRDEEGEGVFDAEDVDEHYELAVRIVLETKRASISALQRRLRVGYNRAARMIEMMEAQGIVGPAIGPKGEREVFADGPGLSGG